MNIGDNVKYLRKNVLRMTRDAFAEKLGVSAGEINNIERSRLAKPELKEPLYRLICNEFNINYEWLVTGKGEMRSETKEDFIKRFLENRQLGYYTEKILGLYLDLSDEKREVIDTYLRAVLEACKAIPEDQEINVIKILDPAAVFENRKPAIDNVTTEQSHHELPEPKLEELTPEEAALEAAELAAIQAEAKAEAARYEAEYLRKRLLEKGLMQQ